MKLFRELKQALLETRRLKLRYHLLTSVIGLIGVSVGLGCLLLVAYVTLAQLGVDLQQPIKAVPHGHLLVIAFLLCLPVFIYLGAVCVGGLFATLMVLLGKFTRAEAIRYALYSRYPQVWFKKK